MRPRNRGFRGQLLIRIWDQSSGISAFVATAYHNIDCRPLDRTAGTVQCCLEGDEGKLLSWLAIFGTNAGTLKIAGSYCGCVRACSKLEVFGSRDVGSG